MLVYSMMYLSKRRLNFMKSTIIEKANQTHGEDEVWKIIDEQERRQVTVIF